MSPQDKAQELFNVFDDILDTNCFSVKEMAKQCAIAAVDQIILENENNEISSRRLYLDSGDYRLSEFYEIVKEEINAL